MGENEREALKREAQQWKQEAMTANATIAEIYQLCTGKTGEPGNWNGAKPVREVLAELSAVRKELEAARVNEARYLWLRHGDNDERVICKGPVAEDYVYIMRMGKLDAAIDAHIRLDAIRAARAARAAQGRG